MKRFYTNALSRLFVACVRPVVLVRSLEQILHEGDVSVPDKLQYGELQGEGGGLGRQLHLLASHPHRLAAELLGELGQLSAGLVEPPETVASDPLDGLVGFVHHLSGRVHLVADAAADQLFLLAVTAGHVLQPGALGGL